MPGSLCVKRLGFGGGRYEVAAAGLRRCWRGWGRICGAEAVFSRAPAMSSKPAGDAFFD